MEELFLANVRFDKTNEDGQTVKVAEQYLVKAKDFAEAELAVSNHVAGGDIEILRITHPKLTDMVVDGGGDKFYRIKILISRVDEKTGKEKKTASVYLVTGEDMEEAMHKFNQTLGYMAEDWEYASVSETKIVDYLYRA